MSNVIWSYQWVEEIADLLGLSCADEHSDSAPLELALKKRQLVEQLIHLPLDKVRMVLDSARERSGQRPPNSRPEWRERFDSFNACVELAQELRQRHGLSEPVNESEEWIAEDRREATLASTRRMQNEAENS